MAVDCFDWLNELYYRINIPQMKLRAFISHQNIDFLIYLLCCARFLLSARTRLPAGPAATVVPLIRR